MLEHIPVLSDALPSETGTLTDRVYRFLADCLMSGRFAPGDKLSMRGVSEALGLSIMPVREAVSRLAAEGALEVEPKKAVTVPLMHAGQFRDITRVRVEIEGFAATLACSAASSGSLAEIEACEALFRGLSEQAKPDLSQAVAANQAFHFAVYRAADSPQLLQIIERLWLRVGPIINLDLRGDSERLRGGGAVQAHRACLQAIRDGDPQAARAAIAADIEGAARFILSRRRLPE